MQTQVPDSFRGTIHDDDGEFLDVHVLPGDRMVHVEGRISSTEFAQEGDPDDNVLDVRLLLSIEMLERLIPTLQAALLTAKGHPE